MRITNHVFKLLVCVKIAHAKVKIAQNGEILHNLVTLSGSRISKIPELFDLVKSTIATGVLLTLFPRTVSPARGSQFGCYNG